MRKITILDFVGTHSSGKTAVMLPLRDILRELGYDAVLIESSSRTKLKSYNLDLYENTGDFQQSFISLLNWSEILSTEADFVLCTDLMVRSMAYTISRKTKDSGRDLTEAHRKMLAFTMSDRFLQTHNVTRFYLPIEFPQVNDGVRDQSSNDYRKDVDESTKRILTSLNVPYITLSGSIPERLRTIISELSRRYFHGSL